MRVVIVEDDPVIIKLIELSCAKAGIETASIWVTGESPAPEHDWDMVDVVVADQTLGQYLGSELLAFLERQHPSIRRVLFTGDTSITEKFAHAHQVLHKPAYPCELVAAIRGDKGENNGK